MIKLVERSILIALCYIGLSVPVHATSINLSGTQNSDLSENLSWSLSDTSDSYMYQLQQTDEQTGDTTTVGLKDHIKVLNVSPWQETDSQYNSLKTWMIDNGFGQGTMSLDTVQIKKFSQNANAYLKDSNGDYKYDVVVFGFADDNNSQGLSTSASNAVKAYAKTGRGVLLGHDTMSSWVTKSVVNSDGSTESLNNGKAFPFQNELDISYEYGDFAFTDTHVKLTRNGYLLNYPNMAGKVGDVLTIPAAHSGGQLPNNSNDVWADFVQSDGSALSYQDMGSSAYNAGINKYVYLYDTATQTYSLATRTYDQAAYLFSHNNWAMIQTGHSNGAATLDEQKLMANTIFYLSQVTNDTHYTTHTSQDVEAPDEPSATKTYNSTTHQLTINNLNSTDHGNKYQYQIIGTNLSDNSKTKSNVLNVESMTGVQKYVYSVDTNKHGSATLSDATITSGQSITMPDNQTSYIHIAAVDGNNNISTSLTYMIDNTKPTLTVTQSTQATVNSPITLTAQATDADSGVAQIQTPDGIWHNSSTISFNADHNGTYSFVVKDNAGNTTNKSVTITNIQPQNTISASAVTNTSTASTTSVDAKYDTVYHDITKALVGSSSSLTNVQLQATMPEGVDPIIENGDINQQKIKVYQQNNDGSLTDVTNQGTLSYTINSSTVPTSTDANTGIDLNQDRMVTWTAKSPDTFNGKTLCLDIPISIQPDSTKLSKYKTSDSISIPLNTNVVENSTVSKSNSSSISVPNIYTLKIDKSQFNTNKTIDGTVYLKLYANLVSQTDTSTTTIGTLSSLGTAYNITTTLNNTNQIIPIKVKSSTLATSPSRFNLVLKNNDFEKSYVIMGSLIHSEATVNGVTTTKYVSDPSSSTSTAAQYKPSNQQTTDAIAPESVETYYSHDDGQSQISTNDENKPTYVRLIELMHVNYNATVSAKAGYGITNDVSLVYFGRHLNISASNATFEKNDLATTFSTNQDLTESSHNTSSKISDNKSELLDYDATVMSINDLTNTLKSLSSAEKTDYLKQLFGSSNDTSATNIDQISSDLLKFSDYNSLSSSQKSDFAAIDSETDSAAVAPQIYQMNYKFNKRILAYTNDDNNGIEYYDSSSQHVKDNANKLTNIASPTGTLTDGGYKFYTNQWLKLGDYTTEYTSTSFGSNNLQLQLNRNINIYGRRYLSRSDNENGDKYDDLSIQPAISGNSNGTGTTVPSGTWKNE